MKRALWTLLRACTASVLLAAGSAHAQDTTGSDEEPAVAPSTNTTTPTARPYDPGPRRVATPTARQRARATRLGLGTDAAAHTLLFEQPRSSWVVAAGGRRPRNFLWPVRDGVQTQGFRAMNGTHRALDVAAPCGTIIRAAHAGLVGYSDNGVYGLGNAVVIVGAGGVVTAYGHARRTLVAAGATVQRGDPIAEVGETGRAHGCHVHFILLRNGERLDPEPLMTGRPGERTAVSASRAREPAPVPRERSRTEPTRDTHPTPRTRTVQATPQNGSRPGARGQLILPGTRSR